MSLLLDLIFPRPYDQLDYYHPVSVKPISHFSSPSLSDCLSVFKYHGIVRHTLIDIKYGFVSDACQSLGSFTSQQLLKSFPNIVRYWQKNQFVLVPIPLHPARHNWRGFNQTEILGQVIANQLNLSYAPVLVRTHDTIPQVSLTDKALRSRNLKNVFTVHHSQITNNMLLFDDIATTYSTLRSAAATLQSAGVKNIFGLTIAG